MRKNDSEGSSPTKPSPGHFIALREEQHGRCLVFSLPEPLFWSHCTGNNRTEKQFSCLLLWHGWGGVLCFLCRNISKLLCRSRAALDPITSTANAIISTPTQCSFTTWPCFSNNCMSLCIYPRKHRPSQQALNSLLTGISGLQGSATCFSLPFPTGTTCSIQFQETALGCLSTIFDKLSEMALEGQVEGGELRSFKPHSQWTVHNR